MLYVDIFWAFFIANILGYGGGPPSIPLIQNEVVNNYGWMTVEQFGEVLALGNALPSPIATKLAGYIGYQVGGALGATVALMATIAPTAIAMVLLLGFMNIFRKAPQVKAMTQSVRPIVAVLLGILAYEFFKSAIEGSGWAHTIILAAVAYVLLERMKTHPALVIGGAMVYGFVLL
jgi:chromate transporter